MMRTNSSTLSYRIKLILCCLLAGAANYLLSYFVDKIVTLPLYLDTLFTCAVTFAAGLLPGIVTALLTTLVKYLVYGIPENTLFIVCVIAEVLLVWSFRRRFTGGKNSAVYFDPAPVSSISTVAVLFLLAVTACITVSILGGLIDFFLSFILDKTKRYYSPEDRFKLGLLRNSMPLLGASIFSRLPINIVDRFITVFGGYSVSVGIRKFLCRSGPQYH